jgi:transposase
VPEYPPLEERFWSRVKKTRSCWLWEGRTHMLVCGDGRVAAHHLSYSMHVRPIPDGWCVRRVCGNNSCVRPEHLEVFQQKGSNHPRAKLTEGEVLMLIAQAKDGVARTQLAERYGVSVSTVGQIINRKIWLTVSAAPPLKPAKRKKKRRPRKKKLTEEQVREIRRRREEGALVISLAEEFGYADPSNISDICNYRDYKDVE